MPDLLLDTDVLVDHLRGVRRIPQNRDRILYSVITRCELFAGRETDEEQIRRLLAAFEELAVVRSIAERAGRLRRTTTTLRTPDALIAATALEHNLHLVTRNTRDYRSVRGLRIQQPSEKEPRAKRGGVAWALPRRNRRQGHQSHVGP